MCEESALTEGEFNEMMGYRPEDTQVVFDLMGANTPEGASGPYAWFSDSTLRVSMPVDGMQYGDARALFLAVGNALESRCKGMGQVYQL